jgi:putative transposase
LVVEGFAVDSICTVLTAEGCHIAARTYRSWKQVGRQVAHRTLSDAVVIDALLATTGTPEGLYCRRKMTAHLRRRVLTVSHHTVDRLMRDLGLLGVRRGRKFRTTVPDPAATDRPTDLLERDFTGPAPNQRWVADLVLTCLRMAVWQRHHDGHPVVPGQLIHHHDAGAQCTALRFTAHLALEGIAPSIGSVGDAYNNCLMDSNIGLFKNECLRPGPFVKDPLKCISDVESPPWPGSTGGTTDGCIPASAWSRPSSTSKRTTFKPLRPDRRRSSHEDGSKPGTLQSAVRGARA